MKQVNSIALVAWASGLVIANLVPGITSLNALLGSAIVYVVGSKGLDMYKRKVTDTTIIGKDEAVNDY